MTKKAVAKVKKSNGPSGHKRFGASNSKQWLTCAGAVALIESMPPSERKSADSIWSRRGTCAHAVGEMSLISYINNPSHATTPEDYLGQQVEGVLVDQEIVDGAEVYVKWARERIDAADHVEIERSGSLAKFIDGVQSDTGQFLTLMGDEYGGTGDFVSAQLMGALDVGDYKNGRGYVDAFENTQMLIYALDALMDLGVGYDFDEVRMTIIQPNGPGEAIRSWTVTPEYVFEWAMTVLLPGAEKAVEAIFALRDGMDSQTFADKYLVADLQGHCHFCVAKSRCVAACGSVCDDALLEFVELVDESGDDAGLTLVLPDIAFISDEQEQAILDNADGIIAFIKAVQERAHARAERGDEVMGHKLVEKGGTRRKYVTGDDVIKQECKKLGLVPHDYMEPPVLKSPAQLEKAFKSRGVNPDLVSRFMQKNIGRNESGVALVRLDDPRPAIQPAIESEFADLFDKQDDLLDL